MHLLAILTAIFNDWVRGLERTGAHDDDIVFGSYLIHDCKFRKSTELVIAVEQRRRGDLEFK